MTEEEILGETAARIEKHRQGDVELNLIGADGRPLEAGVTLDLEQTRHAFLFGSNIFWPIRNRDTKLKAAYEKHFTELLNFATLPFYWWGVETEQGKPGYPALEEMARWCNARGVTVKGHPLVWNYHDPPWLTAAPDEAMKLQLEYVDRSVRRFKKEIKIWDVVNEATEYDRQEILTQGPYMTAAIRKLGVEEYLRQAFETARRADPEAMLLINDYKLTEAYAENIIAKLIDQDGQPFYDAVGLQYHQHGGARPVTEVWDNCESFARFGKPLHITEVTFLSGKQGWELRQEDPQFDWATNPVDEERQARDVVRFYTTLFSHPAVEAITWWDFSDNKSWQNAPAGFLRADMTPKPAYTELKKLVKDKWWTRTTAKTADGGKAGFRGFYGDYQVTATSGGRQLAGAFSLDKTTKDPITVRLSG